MSTAHSFSPFSGKTHSETHWSFLRILYTVHGSSALTNTPLTCHTLPKDGGPANNNILPRPCKLRRCFTMAGFRELSGRENAKKLAWLGEESRMMDAIVTRSREENSSSGF
jgi:hypothetical protein